MKPLQALLTVAGFWLMAIFGQNAQAAGAWHLDKVQMVSRTEGWALAHTPRGSVLLKTFDGGRDWQNVSPRGIWPLSPSQVKSNDDAAGIGTEGIDATFLSAQTGWVAMKSFQTKVVSEAAPEGGRHWTLKTFDDPMVVERTQDGGRHWAASYFPEHIGWSLIVSFSNSQRGFILTISDMASGSTLKGLYRTSDGGRRWEPVTQALVHHMDPTGVMFRNGLQGWVTGGSHGIGGIPFYRTEDAGRHWRLQELEMPPTSTDGITYPPRFFGHAKEAGVLPVQFVGGEAERGTAFYVTGNGGATWRRRHALPLEAYAILTAHHWLGLDSSGTRLYTTSNGGYTWHQHGLAQKIGGPGRDSALDFVDARTGWALINDYGTKTAALLRTQDGGRRWRTVYPPRKGKR